MLGMLPPGASKRPELCAIRFAGALLGKLGHYPCFNEHLYGFLIAGAIFFPIGIIHGWGIWLGFWH
jgi:hypothetical protein